MNTPELLERLGTLAETCGANTLAAETKALAERVSEGRFFVACLGQFKRGKSTLMNALVGDTVLPTGGAPVTSVVTVLRFGERRARVRVGDEGWKDIAPDALGEYVSEASNPENVKRVSAVELFVPSPLLEGGLCLVDTPGVGSVFAGNTAEVKAFVPHIDAALVVVGGDPPISGEELALVESASAQVRDVLFVMNKADRLPEKERQEARRFTEGVLAQRLPQLARRIFEVSAAERLAGKGPARDWDGLVAALRALADQGGTALVERAAKRGIASIRQRLERQLTEERDALLRPAEESRRRIDELRRCAEEAERAAIGLRHLFEAEQEALRRRFEAARVQFEEAAVPRVATAIDELLAAHPPKRGTHARGKALGLAQDETERLVRAWLEQQRPIAEREFAEATERLVSHANDFLARLQASGQLPAGSVPAQLAPAEGLRAPSRFYFAPLNRLADTSGWAALADWLSSPQATHRRAREAAVGLAKHLIEVNASRVVGDLEERITESRRSVESALRRTLKETVSVAQDAATKASATQKLGADAVAREVARVERLLAQLAALGG